MRIARGAATSWQRVDGETVVLQAEVGELLGLNGVGGRAWELLDGTRGLDEIAATISAEYGVAPERAAADVRAFVDELVGAKLLEILDGDR